MDADGAVVVQADWLEQPLVGGFRTWHIMFLSFASLLALVVLLCCCLRFRIPRTKQEIEADYVRKKIARRFQKQLQSIANSDMDDMDLKKALDRVLAELKSESESRGGSEASGSSAAARGQLETDDPDGRGEVMDADTKLGAVAETCFSKPAIKRQDSVLS
ncbi:uncharacterized protein LOC134539920 [Bacillus rossius redtenbacheri]|uniref:uncharacterized protein LOC134539920 n=1 Tax=Bacillus rossius redtenbacheri TaxID=93214 RepID=UPI002FDE5F33